MNITKLKISLPKANIWIKDVNLKIISIYMFSFEYNAQNRMNIYIYIIHITTYLKTCEIS